MTEDPQGKDMDKVREKVRLLLNLTTDRGATEAEAATALSTAMRILEKYNLDMKDVGNGNLEAGMGSTDVVGLFYQWERSLIQTIAKHNMCDCVRYEGKHLLIGRNINTEAAREMYLWLSRRLNIMVYEYISERPEDISANEWRNNFLWGATSRIKQRLQELQDQRHTVETECKALVLDRHAEAFNYRGVLFPGRGWVSKNLQSSTGSGFGAGQSAGNTIPLERQDDLTSGSKQLA